MMRDATTLTVDEMSPEQRFDWQPSLHPDWVGLDRETPKHDHPTVYVPMLAHAVERLGGPENLLVDDAEDWGGGPTGEIGSRHGKAIVQAHAFRDRDGAGYTLHVFGWHPKDRFVEVVFDLPERWRGAEWTVAFAAIMGDLFSGSADLERLVASRCDRIVGRGLASEADDIHIHGTDAR
jgi:hypothetical protein